MKREYRRNIKLKNKNKKEDFHGSESTRENLLFAIRETIRAQFY